ncbi:MAG: phosphoribosylformylglycinamidine synthase subunit PurS [Deltaproteobacteria bacterium]|nr:phosphoribosylformylglycinamidine synthase subunit PurS [Deltaproteobacteria bacterium]
MKIKIYITLKAGVLDPQGKAVEHALGALGFQGVEGVRIGKYIEVVVKEPDRTKAEAQVKSMCEKVLANTVIESYRYDIE